MAAAKLDLGVSAARPRTHGSICGLHFRLQNLSKHEECNQQMMFKKSTPKHQHWCRKSAKKGVKTDAQIFQITLPKQVSDNIMKIIKNHVFLNGKIIQIHCKNNGFWRFCSLRARTERESNNIKTETEIQLKIDTKPMWKQCSNKWCQNDGKFIENGSQKLPNR